MELEIENFKKYLSGIAKMDDATFELCVEFLKVELIKKGEFLATEGAVCNKIAYISSGLFRIFYLKNGTEINTCFCLENSLTSSFESFVNRTTSKENIQAIEDSTIVTITNDKLLKLYQLSPHWHSISRLLTERECLRLTNRATSLSFESALEKYKSLLANQPEIIKRVPIQDIASYLGVSRETLSRIRSKLN